MMKRRDFITLVGGAAAARWPMAASAQQAGMPVIGYLDPGSSEAMANRVEAFRNGLRESGYVEGVAVAIEYRWANNDTKRLPELAADLVRRNVAVIAALGNPAAALAAKAATPTIPIVFAFGSDPVRLGLVSSLNRPSSNATGFTSLNAELGAKKLGLLKELLPRAIRIGVIVNPNYPETELIETELQTAAVRLGLQLDILSASTIREIDQAFGSLAQARPDALLVSLDTLFTNRHVQITTLATRLGLPTLYPNRDYVQIGGLMSYGSYFNDLVRQAGIYVGRILKGEKPADLPVMLPTKYEFVINLQTAKTLGIEVPPTLLARADEVIE